MAKYSNWRERVDKGLKRLHYPKVWFWGSALVPLCITILSYSYLLRNANPQLYNPVNQAELQTGVASWGEMWLSVTQNERLTQVVSSEGLIFIIDGQAPKAGIDDLTEHLTTQVEKAAHAAALRLREKQGNTLVLNVEESVQYRNMVPVLYAIAASGISRYSFETFRHGGARGGT